MSRRSLVVELHPGDGRPCNRRGRVGRLTWYDPRRRIRRFCCSVRERCRNIGGLPSRFPATPGRFRYSFCCSGRRVGRRIRTAVFTLAALPQTGSSSPSPMGPRPIERVDPACTVSSSHAPSSGAPNRRGSAWRGRLRSARFCRRACLWRCAWPAPTCRARRSD